MVTDLINFSFNITEVESDLFNAEMSTIYKNE